jgi:hypothetical protein
MSIHGHLGAISEAMQERFDEPKSSPGRGIAPGQLIQKSKRQSVGRRTIYIQRNTLRLTLQCL